MKRLHALLVTSAVLCAAADVGQGTPSPADAPLQRDVYVWQRLWTEPVQAAALARATNFTTVVPLAAEVSWLRSEPSVVRLELPYETLKQTGRPIGLALRVGPFPGSFSADDAPARALAGLAASLVTEARTNGLAPVELQLDFDCAESKLAGYRVWVESIRRHVAPVPVVFTALPAWLKHAEFAALARAADGFVLQVHSLEAPRSVDASFTLCDPAAARRAVSQAARCGVPFRVALPTYGYITAFDRRGKFIGLSAEGPARTWPVGARQREVLADPAAIADLVAEWTKNRPASMRGVIWYRLPVPGDTLNWRWPTLATVMAGQAPVPGLRVTTRRAAPGLVEIELHNDGARDEVAATRIALRWSAARVIACDGLMGFQAAEGAGEELRFHSPPARVPAGTTRRVGWARFDRETAVEVKLESD